MRNSKFIHRFVAWRNISCNFMKTLQKQFSVLALIIFLFGSTIANNVTIPGKATILPIDNSKVLLTFGISWENSWRVGENWDAVWIFVKYKRVGVNEPWYHAHLNSTGFKTAGGGGYPEMEFLPQYLGANLAQYDTIYQGNNYPPKLVDDLATGVFMFRRRTGSGDINIPRVSLEWDFSQGDLNMYHDITIDDIRNGDIEVSVQAIEMVYVPMGPYALGEVNLEYSFIDTASSGMPKRLYIHSDSAKTIQAMGQIHSDRKTIHVPDLYPMGYNGFYIMKYEVSQEQYVNFLNRLPYNEQKKRVMQNLSRLKVGEYVLGDKMIMPDKRNGIVVALKDTLLRDFVFADPSTGVLDTLILIDTVVTFGFNENPHSGPAGFSDDGKDIACNFISPEDVIAYLDWIGLRPISEMEYEKSCRKRWSREDNELFRWPWGDQPPTPLSWNMDDVKKRGEEDEYVVNSKNTNGPIIDGRIIDPVRVGAFANATTTKQQAGASHWGVMELAGNLAEICYNVSSTSVFREGIYGDGNIQSSVLGWSDSLLVMSAEIYSKYTSPNLNVFFTETLILPGINKKGKTLVTKIDHNRLLKDCKFENNIYNNSGRLIGKRFSTEVVISYPFSAWPIEKEDFGLRGGSFSSEQPGGVDGKKKVMVSNREDVYYYTDKTMGTRENFVGFRGGLMVPTQKMKITEIICENNQLVDTFFSCAPNCYKIKESVIWDDADMALFQWEMCEKVGANWAEWQKIDKNNVDFSGANERELAINKLNRSMRWAEYKFRRKSIASHAEGYGNSVILCTPGAEVSADGGLRIDPYASSAVMNIRLGAVGTVEISWKKSLSSSWKLLRSKVYDSENLESNESLNRSDFHPDILNGTQGQVDLQVKVIFEGSETCPIVIMRGLTLDKQENIDCSSTLQYEGILYKNSCMLGSVAVWLIPDLDYDIPAGKTWGAVSDGYYSMQHVEAAVNGKLKLCPEGYEIPSADIWNKQLYEYYYPKSDIDFSGKDENSLSDQDLERFRADFCPELDGMNLTGENGWWTSSQGIKSVYTFSEAYPPYFPLMFGPSATDMSNAGKKFKIRCVKVQK